MIKKLSCFTLLLFFAAGCCLLSGCTVEEREMENMKVWKKGNVTYQVDLTNGANPVTIKRGKSIFHPFDGFGPVVRIDGTVYKPGEAKVTVLASKKDAEGVHMNCTLDALDGKEKIPYELFFSFQAGKLYVNIKSESDKIIRIEPGLSKDFGAWKQRDITRYGEFYENQDWYAQPVYHVEGKFFVFADWEHTKGNGTDYARFSGNNGSTELRTNAPTSGTGAKEMATSVVYTQNLNGKTMPVNETLYISASDSLWETIPEPVEEPTQYKDQLKDKVYFDVWTGSISNAYHILYQLDQFSNKQAKFLTVFQDWGAVGWDATLPENYNVEKGLMPRGGSLEEIKEFVSYAKTFGFAGLRTNYVWMSGEAPSFKEGEIQKAKAQSGGDNWFVKPSQWLVVPGRQEADINKDFDPNCNFSDQLTSGSMTPAYVDYDSDDTSMRFAIEKERELIEFIKSINPGPFGSESSAADFLLGKWCDYGEYGIYKGHERKALLPDYKLRRIHPYGMMYGMGIPYRWFEEPPFPKFQNDQSFAYSKAYIEGMDDYRACEVLYGNGAYIGYMPNTPYEFMLTEVNVVGRLQKYYAFEEVDHIYYLYDGKWKTLEQLFAFDDVTDDVYTRVKVVYKNGLNVYVNRSEAVLEIKTPKGSISLPQYGWVAFKEKDKVFAYSAFYPGTNSRIDYFEDGKMAFINPRGAKIDGVDKMTLKENGKIMMQYENMNEYLASKDFSGDQGKNRWFYESYDSESKKYSKMEQYDAEKACWVSGEAMIGQNWQKAMQGKASVRKWVAPYNGMTTISGAAKLEKEPEGNIELRITRNGELLESIPLDHVQEYSFKVRCNAKAGDQIRTEIHCSGNTSGARVICDPLVKYYR